MPMWDYYGFWNGMGIWMIVTSLIWLGIAALIVWLLVRWFMRATRENAQPPREAATPPDALTVLQTRYARGEIDAETYARMRAILQDSEESPRAVREPTNATT